MKNIIHIIIVVLLLTSLTTTASIEVKTDNFSFNNKANKTLVFDSNSFYDFECLTVNSGCESSGYINNINNINAENLGFYSETMVSSISISPSNDDYFAKEKNVVYSFINSKEEIKPSLITEGSISLSQKIVQPLTFIVSDKISHDALSGALIVVSNVGIGTTDISGEYIFGSIQGGTYDYTVFRNGYYQKSGTFTYPDQRVINVEMDRWPNVTFTVLDTDGDPLPNALVSFGGISQYTDIVGQTTFMQVVPLDNHQWTASADGFQTISGEEYIGGDDANIEVKFITTLPKILFNVTDVNGNPVSNANVQLDGSTQITNFAGQALFQLTEPFQNHSWSISANAYKTVSGEQYASNSLVNVNVTLQPDYLTFSIVDNVTGAPLQNAVLTLNGTRYLTDSNGKIVMPNIPNGNYSVSVSRHIYNSFNGTLAINSNEVTIGLSRIQSVSLPYSQTFDSSVPANFSFYDTQVNSQKVWDYSGSSSSGGTFGEMMARWRNGVSTVRMILPPINTQGFSSVELLFRYFFDDWGGGMKVLVESSVDGNNWSPVGWEVVSGAGNSGPSLVKLLLNTNTNSQNTYIAFTLTGNLYQFDLWYIDNVVVREPGLPFNSTIKVIDGTNGQPIEGAQVSVDGFGSVLTNSNGLAYFTNLPNSFYNYSVIKDGFSLYEGSFTINNENVLLNVVLSPMQNYSLTVNVREFGTATPIQGAQVTLPGIPSVETNAQGQVFFPAIPSGIYPCKVTRNGYDDQVFAVNLNHDRVYDVSLRSNIYDVNFTVVDVNSIPVPNAVVSIVGGISVATNESGQVTIPGVMNGAYLYKIEKSGYTTYNGTVNVSYSDVNIGRTLVVAPPVTYSAKFKVVDIYGALISNASINIAGYGSYLTNFLGEYTLTGLSDGANLSYGVIKANYFDAIGVLGPINKNEEITIVLKPIVIQTYTVIFNVVDINGNPLAGASVDLGSYGTITTNGAGSATATNVSYTDQLPYSITLAGYKTVTGNAAIHINTVVNVILPLSAATTYSVTFNVTNSTGVPVSNALVTLVGYGTLLTNNSGAATFNQVNPQNGISYTVAKPPYANLTGGVNVVNANIVQNLTLNTNVYRAVFTVNDQFGNPAEGVNVEVLGVKKVVTDNYGNAIVGGLAPGNYSYNVFRSNESPLNAGFNITNSDLSIPVTLASTRNVGSVTFILRDEFNALVENASVEIDGYGTKVSDAIGQVTFTNIMSTTSINYKVTKLGFEDYSDVLTISSSSIDKNLVLKFKRYSVQFSVNSGTKSISDAVITFNNISNSAGDYLFTNILVGNGYAYSVAKAGYTTVTGTVNVNSYTGVSINIEEEKFPVTFNVAPNASKSIDQSFDAKIMLGGRTDTLSVNTAGQTALNLTKGHYSFKAWANGYQAYYGTFEVVNGAVTVDVKLSISTGLDNNLLSSIKVYPNPFVKEIVVLNCKDVEGIVVTNIIGQPVTEFTNNGGDRLTINAESLTSGIYFVRLKATDGSTRVVRMVKQ